MFFPVPFPVPLFDLRRCLLTNERELGYLDASKKSSALWRDASFPWSDLETLLACRWERVRFPQTFQKWPRQTKPKKGQFMNFSQGRSGTKVQCESCLFSQGKTPEFTKMAEIHELFVLALSLVWFAGATPEPSENCLDWAASIRHIMRKPLCAFEPRIWLEIITSHDAKNACFQGSRTSCDVIISGCSWADFG